jgi:2-C-methyl-D-erythritol 4-phosphate cytidylyltransferase
MTAPAALWAVVPAAGLGRRFASEVPKQYLPLHGRAVLSWSLAALLAEPRLRCIAVPIDAADARWSALPEAADPRLRACRGGATRAESVAAGLATLADEARETDWVLVHDAARPCLHRDDLAKLLATVADDPVGGLLAVPLDDTLKQADESGGCVATLPREGLWRALTPQMFRYGLLRRALALCLERGRTVTDEASAIEALGLRPRLVHGRGDNFKLTIASDIELAAAVLRVRD